MNLPSRPPSPEERVSRLPNGHSLNADLSATPRAPNGSTLPYLPVNTSVAMTVTPASAAAMSSAASSRAASPLSHRPALRGKRSFMHDRNMENGLSPQIYPTMSPSVLPRSSASERAIHERSPSPHTRMAPPSAMSEAIAAGKSPGLIRRLSRGAHSKLRRRASTTQSMRMRDQSAGPVLMRRRSDSNGAADMAQEMSDLDLDSSPDVPDDVMEEDLSGQDHPNGLGINILGRTSNASSALSGFEGGIAPAISAVLEQGTWVTKHTTKKTKRIKIWLDPDAARVCWHASKPAKSFFIDDVREIRVGADSRNARDDVQVPNEHENRMISIIYELPERSKGRTIKNMHLMTPDAYITNLWADALNKVTRERIEIMNALSSSVEKSEKSMAMAWRRAMARKGPDAEEFFTLDDARWLCRKLEINCSDHTVRTHFTRSDTLHAGLLDYPRYRDFVDSFKERKDIQHLYRNISFGTDLDMDMETFMEFLRIEQCVDVVKERSHWEAVFDKYAKTASSQARSTDGESTVSTPRTMNMQGFQNFMISSYSSPLLPKKSDVVLDRPLNEYFISSSHNTYLLGRQVAGASSVEGYISALVKGCRCIEIDCWDGDDGRPMVTHGRTMTTKIPFADCVSVVAKYAFHSTPYPLIVSLEVHCNPEQQLAMVELMEKHWSGTMVIEPFMNDSVALPSPDELRHKILVKVKASEDLESEQASSMDIPNGHGRSRARSINSTLARTPSMEPSYITASPLVSSPPATSPSDYTAGPTSTPRGSTTSGPTMSPATSSDDSDHVTSTRKGKTSKIIWRLGKLGIYTQGIKYGGFSAPEARTYNHVFSFAENTFAKLCSRNHENKALLEKHNMRYLMRVYPGPRRIDSSNFNPLQHWRRGVQMAALNWQTHDVHMQVNEAMFAAGSDRHGYVLKPEELRQPKHLAIADILGEGVEANREKKGKKLVKFAVDIVSAQRLPRPRNQAGETGMNPYIEFEMFAAEDKARGIAKGEGGTDVSARDGMLGIGSPLRKRTRVVEGNGFDPVYNQSLSVTVETRYTSLIFVRWTVWNSPDGRRGSSNNTLLATFTAKLDSLQQGYRHLPLFNPNGEQYRDAKLFVKIHKDPPIALTHDGSTNGGIVEPAPSPRPEPVQIPRTERSWPRRLFNRNPSERRRREQYTSEPNGDLSRTSSMDRESVR